MLFKNDKAISPVVATLVLIVVAIIGAAAVGVILGAFGSDVSNQASADNSKNTASQEITVGGSTTVQPVSDLIAKAYMDANPGVKITVQGGGSDAGIAGAGMGVIDVGAASKYMDENYKTKYPDLTEHVIGGSAVVLITNNLTTANNANLTTTVGPAAAYSLYDTGAVNNTAWKANVIAVQRSEGSGTEETFAKWASNNAVSNLDAAVDKGSVTQANAIGNQGVLDKVASTPLAVGFVDYGFAKGNNKVIIIGIDGFPAVTESSLQSAVKDMFKNPQVTSALYPNNKDTGLTRPLVYLTPSKPSAVVNSFVNFASSPASLDFFHKAGYWGITELQKA